MEEGNPGGMVYVDTSPTVGEQDQNHNRNQCSKISDRAWENARAQATLH